MLRGRLAIGGFPAGVDPGDVVAGGQRGLAQDVVGGFFADHDGGRVEVAIGDAGEDGAIGDAQVFDADDAAFGIDDGHCIVGAAHAAGAAGVVGAFGVAADVVIEFVVGLVGVAGQNFLAAVRVERRLAEDFA